MQRSQSAAFVSAVERFGLAAQALVSEGASLDEVVRWCGAVAPVDPRPAELAVVRHMSGFTENGALRVLALRERLLELRRAGLPPFNAVTRMRHQLESMQIRPKRERQEEEMERPSKRALSQGSNESALAAAAEARERERERERAKLIDRMDEGEAFDINEALTHLDRVAAAAFGGREGDDGGGGVESGGVEGGGIEGGGIEGSGVEGGGESGGDEEEEEEDDDELDGDGAMVAFDEWMPMFGDVHRGYDEDDGDDEGGASGQEAEVKRVRLGP